MNRLVQNSNNTKGLSFQKVNFLHMEVPFLNVNWMKGYHMKYLLFLSYVRHALTLLASSLGRSCFSQVSVSVDYAYAMTALTILCQFFIGIVALPTPAFRRGAGAGRGRGRCRRCRLFSPAGCCLFFFLSCRGRGCCSPSSSSSSSRHREPSPCFRSDTAARGAAGVDAAWGEPASAAPASRGRGKEKTTPPMSSLGLEACAEEGRIGGGGGAAVVGTCDPV